nr:struthiocalcin-1-like [Zootoca vivipara]
MRRVEGFILSSPNLPSFSFVRAWTHLSPSLHQNECQRQGGHLASILDRKEHNAVARFLQQAQRWDDDEDVWFGLSIPDRSKSWAWADGSPVSYTAWEKYKSYPALKGEHCAVLDESSGFMLWDNDSCYDRNPFICKV